MTIHADWAKVIKMKHPHCFSTQAPQGPKCGIIDGHIQLMGAYHVSSWEQFLQSQFGRPIRQLFAHGCTTVVLLFDNRNAVPPYKGMTQYKRCKRYEDVQFSATDSLPAEPPAPWADHMMNRHFKDKVIAFVCERIQPLIKPTRERVLIVDFKGPPKLYTDPVACPSDIRHLHEMGESDVKFVRYVHMLGDSIVYATDGDYIAISLLYYSMHSAREGNRIFIFRQTANTGEKQPAQAAPTATSSTTAASAPTKPKRSMEYMHMQHVFVAIMAMMRCAATDPPETVTRSVIAFVTTMLLAGTDYSRGIPLVGPRRIVDLVPNIRRQMLAAVGDLATGFATSPCTMADTLAACIYRAAFAKQLERFGHRRDVCTLLDALQQSPLSERNKGLLPSPEQVHTTCRNVCWVVHYWKDCINADPDLSQAGVYGFEFDATLRQYAWTDTFRAAMPACGAKRKQPKSKPGPEPEPEPAPPSASTPAPPCALFPAEDPATRSASQDAQLVALHDAAVLIQQLR